MSHYNHLFDKLIELRIDVIREIGQLVVDQNARVAAKKIAHDKILQGTPAVPGTPGTPAIPGKDELIEALKAIKKNLENDNAALTKTIDKLGQEITQANTLIQSLETSITSKKNELNVLIAPSSSASSPDVNQYNLKRIKLEDDIKQLEDKLKAPTAALEKAKKAESDAKNEKAKNARYIEAITNRLKDPVAELTNEVLNLIPATRSSSGAVIDANDQAFIDELNKFYQAQVAIAKALKDTGYDAAKSCQTAVKELDEAIKEERKLLAQIATDDSVKEAQKKVKEAHEKVRAAIKNVEEKAKAIAPGILLSPAQKKLLEDLFETEEQFANHFQINAFVKLERTFKDLELEIFDDTDGSGPVVELENSELGYSPKRLQEVLDRLDNGKLYLGKKFGSIEVRNGDSPMGNSRTFVMPNNNLGLAKLGAQAMAATNVTEIKRLYDGSESARLAFAGSALACGVDIKNIGGDIKTDKEKQWQRIFDIKRRRKPKPPEIDPVTKQRKLELSADAQLFEGDYRFDFAQLYIDLGNEPDHETLRTMVLKSLDFEQIGAMIKKLKADATAWNSFNSQLSQLYSNTTKKADFIKQIILVDATLRIDFFIDLTAVQQAKIYNLYVPSPAFSDATALYKQLSTRGTVITRHNALVTVITNMNVAEITALINNKSALGLNLDETINAIADAMTQKTDAECTAIINHLKTNITKDSRKTATLAKIFSKLSPKQKEDMVKTGTTDTMAVLFYAALTTNDDKKAYIKELLKSGKAAQINTITDPNVTNTFLPQILRENPQINVAPLYIHYGTSTPPDTAKQTALLLALDITQHFALFKSLSPTQRVAYLKLMLSADSMKFLDLVVHIHNKKQPSLLPNPAMLADLIVPTTGAIITRPILVRYCSELPKEHRKTLFQTKFGTLNQTNILNDITASKRSLQQWLLKPSASKIIAELLEDMEANEIQAIYDYTDDHGNECSDATKAILKPILDKRRKLEAEEALISDEDTSSDADPSDNEDNDDDTSSVISINHT